MRAFVKKLICFAAASLVCSTSTMSQSEFSQENAEQILRTLVVEIGPRPMGSPAEQQALTFAVDKFRAYGCDTGYVLPMTVAEGVNTTSGVAIGLKKGKTGRIIIIGGHIDTSGPNVPGANDDGSGTACVIELARVLCRRNNESTVMFCCWGGEEQGLQGSMHFVNTFAHLDSVVLMLQIDMADGSSYLIADPDGTKESAPSWLLAAAFEISRDLKRDDLVYQTGAATWNLASGGSFGSDHIPFIDKGIPAIDFTSDVTFPIHTPQDSWENFTPSGLKRSGDLVLKLFERFDAGVPSRTTERYQVLQWGSTLLFLPYPLLWAFIVLSVACGIAGFIISRRRRLPADAAANITWSRWKALLAALVIQAFAWSSETVVGFIKGHRFPWVNNDAGSLLLGLLFGLIGLWLVLQALRRYRLSEEAHQFAGPAFVLLLLFTLLSSFVTPELGMYAAASLLCFSLAVMVRRPMVKLIWFALSVWVMYNLFFFEGLGLFQRVIAQNQIAVFWQKALLHLAYIIAFTFFSLPFVYGFAAIYRGSGTDLLGLRRFRSRSGLMVTLLATIGVMGYLLAQPVYDKLWFNGVSIIHRYDMEADTGSLVIRGSEYLRGLSGSIAGRDTTLDGRDNLLDVPEAKGVRVGWVDVHRTNSRPTAISDSIRRMDRMLAVRSAFRPLRMDVVYESEQPFDIRSEWAHGPKTPDRRMRETDRRKVFRWYAFPDTFLTVPVTFFLRDTQRVRENVEILFDSVTYPIRLAREFTNVQYRTTITSVDTFGLDQR